MLGRLGIDKVFKNLWKSAFRMGTGKKFKSHFRSRQGEAIGRPGEMDVRVDMENGEPQRVQIVGEAVIAFETEICL